jgi:cell division protein FtsB
VICAAIVYATASLTCLFPGLGANLDKIRELEEEKSKLSSEGEHMAAAVSQLERKLKNLESFMITASLPVPVEKRTSVSRHSWAPGKGSKYDANAAPICLLPPELQEQAAVVKSAWSDAGSAEEVQALREMAELLRQENEALRASGASSGVAHTSCHSLFIKC